MREGGTAASRPGGSNRANARVAIGVLLGALALAAWSSGAEGRAGFGSGNVPPPDGARIAWVRVYQDGQWTARGETPDSVGAALASIKPTYVTSLIRLSRRRADHAKEIAAWNTIRAAVEAASPQAQFAIELNAIEFPNVAKLNNYMARVRTAFDNEGWMFDFWTTAAKRKAKVPKAAIANAHANNEWIGGNAFGIAQNPRIPAGTDFLEVQDSDFRINLNAVRDLARRLPVHFHLGNSPDFPNSDGCVFIREYSTAKRRAYITRRATQQAQYNFRLGYPVFFPECLRNRNTNQSRVFTYNAPNDDPMMDTIGTLMDQYD